MSVVHQEQSWSRSKSLQFALAGALALFIAMGVGRFAYTPILPLMQSSQHFSNAVAGFLASSNYLGYLVGAFVAGASWIVRHRVAVYRLSLAINVITTGVMAATSDIWTWLLLRLVSGMLSGLVFVLVSSIVLDALVKHGHSRLTGLFYGGVGFGIAVTGIVVAELGNHFGWRWDWIALMALSIVIGIPAVIWVQDSRVEVKKSDGQAEATVARSYFPWLMLAYGCEGLGYIITGTFLVTMVATDPTLHGFASYCWIVVGIAALPSCLAWSFITHRMGAVVSLVAAFVLQAVGVILPMVVHDPVGIFVGSILFGGTFMGITTTATTLARNLHPEDSSRAIGLMTGVYGVGQIIGAVGAGVLANRSDGFALPTVLAAGVLVIGTILLLVGGVRSSLQNSNEIPR